MKLLRRTPNGILAAVLAAAALTLSSPAVAGGGDNSLRAIEQAQLTREEKQVLGDQVRAAVEAGVMEDDVDVIVTRSLARGIDAPALGRFLETPTRAARRGLPSRPVLDRIEQGLSKGIPPERIDAAGKRLADGLAEAKLLTDRLLLNGLPQGAGGTYEAALETVARAYEQGLSAGTMQNLGEKVRTRGQSLEQFERAVRTRSFLAGNGMQAEAADRVVHACIERNFTERDHARLEQTVSDMVRQGKSMNDIARAADREVREGRGHGEGRDSGNMERGPVNGKDAGGRTGRGR
jgi:hypothetical protein